MAVITFHQRMARVRENVARLDDALQYAEAVGAGDRLTLQVAQLPFEAGALWIGLPRRPDRSGRLSLIAHSPEPLDLDKAIAGLMVDEWVEVVPAAEETTGVVFQYDQPDSHPPQAILIAVPPMPEQQNHWNQSFLLQTLREALSLVRIRAVTPELLDDVAQYLPATYFALNTAGDTITTDFLD